MFRRHKQFDHHYIPPPVPASQQAAELGPNSYGHAHLRHHSLRRTPWISLFNACGFACKCAIILVVIMFVVTIFGMLVEQLAFSFDHESYAPTSTSQLGF